jgi:hypothetical protein
MKRALIAVGVAGVAAATAGTVVVAGTASASTPASGTFTVRAHHQSDTHLDLGTKGFGAGDQDLFTGPLTRGGRRVGWLAGSCTVARVGRNSADQLCEFVLHLGAAQITAEGAVRAGQNGPGLFTLPVLGGTGRYRGASGQVAVTPTDGPSLPIKVSLDR